MMSNQYIDVRFQESDEKETKTHAYFNARVATDAIAQTKGIGAGLRFNTKSLRKMARDINTPGKVKVQVGHDQDFAIGKPIKAKYNRSENSTEALFDIQKGLKIQRAGLLSPSGYESSDDYINAIRGGTLDKISAGMYVKKVDCGRCGEQMAPVLLYDWSIGWRDKNGHIADTYIYVNSKGEEFKTKKRGTKEVYIFGYMDEIDTFEFSLVNRGAIPGAEIIKKIEQAYNAGELEDYHLALLAKQDFVTFSNDKLVFDKPKRSRKSFTIGGKKTMDRTEQLELELENRDKLIQKMKDTQAEWDVRDAEQEEEIITLTDENNSLKETAKQAEEYKKKIDELEAQATELAANAHKVKLYDNLVEKAVHEAVFQWTRAQGASGRNPNAEAQEKQAEAYRTMGNYEMIMAYADQDRRLAVQKNKVQLNSKADDDKTSNLDFNRLS